MTVSDSHFSLPVINLANGYSSRKCTKEEIEEKRKAAQLRLAQTRQRNLKRN